MDHFRHGRLLLVGTEDLDRGQAMNSKSPGKVSSGYLPLPVEFEDQMKLFSSSTIKTYLAIRFRTIWNNHVSLSTAALARITGLSQDSVRKSILWLEFPDARPTSAEQGLQKYIRRQMEQEHADSDRLVQTIYIEDWQEPRALNKRLRESRNEAGIKQQTNQQKGGEQ